MVQLSHSYMTTGKTIALAIWTFADKVMEIIDHYVESHLFSFIYGQTGCFHTLTIVNSTAVNMEILYF